MARELIDLLVTDAVIVTMDPQRRVIEHGFVAIRDGAILEVGSMGLADHHGVGGRDDSAPDGGSGGPSAAGEAAGPSVADVHEREIDRFDPADTIEARGCAVIPGLVNAHTHAAMTIFRGMADDIPLAAWLNDHIWPAEARFVDPEFIHAGTQLAAYEMLSGGVTTYADMYFYQEDAARAAREIGIRAALGEALLDFPTPNAKTPAEGMAYQKAFNMSHETDPWAFGIVMPHAPYSCAPEVLKDAKALARELGAVYYIHLAESADELHQVAERSGGLTPVAYLDSLGVLDEMTTGAHGVQLSSTDIALLAERGAKIVHCPESNMKLASGMAPVCELLEAGVTVGLGTDGAASNNDLSILSEMDTAAKLAKVREMDPAVLPAHTVVEMATLGGATCLGLDHLIGSVEAGKRADLAVINLNAPHLVPLYDVYSQLVYACDAHDVIHTVVNGKVVMRNRQIETIDTSAVVEEAVRFAEVVKSFDRSGA